MIQKKLGHNQRIEVEDNIVRNDKGEIIQQYYTAYLVTEIVNIKEKKVTTIRKPLPNPHRVAKEIRNHFNSITGGKAFQNNQTI